MKTKVFDLTALMLIAVTAALGADRQSIVAPGASVEKLAEGFTFTEGPAADKNAPESEDVSGAYTFSGGDTPYSHHSHLYKQAVEHMGKREYREAEAIYGELIEKEPGSANGYIGLGSCLGVQSRFNESRDAYAEALRLMCPFENISECKPNIVYPDGRRPRDICDETLKIVNEALSSLPGDGDLTEISGLLFDYCKMY